MPRWVGTSTRRARRIGFFILILHGVLRREKEAAAAAVRAAAVTH
jgi:hypothetical protein